MTQPPKDYERVSRTYYFDIRRGRCGFWWWHLSGCGIAQCSESAPHLPRRSRQACVDRAEAYAQRQEDKKRRDVEYRYEVPG